MIVVLNYIKS